MPRPAFTLVGALLAAASLTALAGCGGGAPQGKDQAAAHARTCPRIADTPVRLAGGSFEMGEEDVYDEEGPVRTTTVHGF